LTTLYHPRKAS